MYVLQTNFGDWQSVSWFRIRVSLVWTTRDAPLPEVYCLHHPVMTECRDNSQHTSSPSCRTDARVATTALKLVTESLHLQGNSLLAYVSRLAELRKASSRWACTAESVYG